MGILDLDDKTDPVSSSCKQKTTSAELGAVECGWAVSKVGRGEEMGFWGS